MTKEQIVSMFSDRLDGLTYEEIGQKHGITKQRVHQLLTSEKKERKIMKSVYKRLNAWMRINNVSGTEFGQMIGISAPLVHKYLKGFDGMPKRVIDKILKETGMTYEECFEVTDGERE